MKKLSPEDRLIVSADFKPVPPHGREWVRSQVLSLADSLDGTGVILKVNFALRALGYGLVDEIYDRGLRVLADLKLIDIASTLQNDGVLLREANPYLVTAMCTAGVSGLQALAAELPDTEVLGVTVLTSHTDDDTNAMFTCSTEEAVLRLAHFAADAKLGGFISSPQEAAVLRANFGMMLSINTPGIRPKWAVVSGDDQNPNRVMTPTMAIKSGADRIVVGRPITNPPPGMTPYDAAMRIVDEIARAA